MGTNKTAADHIREIAETCGAKQLWSLQGPENTSVERLRMFIIPATGRLLLFETYKDDKGWEVFTQPTLSNSIGDTRAAVATLHQQDLAAQA